MISSLKWIGLGLLLAVAVATAMFIANIATVGQRVASKTLETNNVITSYEWFYDASGQLDARSRQIRQYQNFYSEAEDPAERNRLRIDMAAVQQSCRDLAAKYNANSQKMNRSIFKGWSLPDAFSPSFCE